MTTRKVKYIIVFVYFCSFFLVFTGKNIVLLLRIAPVLASLVILIIMLIQI